MAFQRPQAAVLGERLDKPRRHLQVVAGSRQVGKTTLVQHAVEAAGLPVRSASADEPTLRGPEWIAQQWHAARLVAADAAERLLEHGDPGALVHAVEQRRRGDLAHQERREQDGERIAADRGLEPVPVAAAVVVVPEHVVAREPAKIGLRLVAERPVGRSTIAEAAVSCDFKLAKTPPDFEKLYVFEDLTDQVVRDPKHLKGWDYDAAKNSVTLYGQNCSDLKKGITKEVNVVYGCPGNGGGGAGGSGGGLGNCETGKPKCDKDNLCPPDAGQSGTCTQGCCTYGKD